MLSNLDFVQDFMYNKDNWVNMKKRDLEKKLSKLGWYFYEHGGSHDSWTNGKIKESIPRHIEVSEMLAKKIIKKAENNPPEKDVR